MIKPSRVIARRISGARRVVRRLALALMAALLAAQAVGPATLPAVAGELGYSGSVVGAAPVAYWKLDDSSGQSLAANAVNPPQNTGVMKGYSMGFDGGAGYVATNLDVQPSAMPTTTWEAWIMPQPNNGFDQAILCNDDGGWDRCVNILGSSGNFLVFTGSGTLWFPVAATFGQWQHIAVVYSQNNVLFYKNGQQFSYGQTPFVGQGTTGASANKLTLGKNPGFGANYKGLMDEVAVYNKALTSSEIQMHANARTLPTLNYPDYIIGLNPTAYWPMDETSGSLVASIGHTYDGTSFGAVARSQSSGLGFAQTVGSLFGGAFPNSFGAFFAGGGGISTDLDASPQAMQSTTWEAWVLPARLNYGSRQALMCTDDGAWDRCLVIEGGTSNFGVFSGKDNTIWQPTSVNGLWQHIAVVYTPNNVFFYKNGVQFTLNETPFANHNGATVNRFTIGRNPGFGDQFKGMMDNVAVYNSALTPAQIRQHYLNGIDITPPTMTALKNPAANAAGWNNTDVTVTAVGTDSGAGISSCSAATVTGEGVNLPVTVYCGDQGGNSSSLTVDVRIDRSPPGISNWTVSAQPNAAGWHQSRVTYTLTAADNLSGVGVCPPATVSQEGASVPVVLICSDRAGNTRTQNLAPIKVDLTPPALTLPGTQLALAPAGRGGVTVAYTGVSANDALSGVAGAPACTPASGSYFLMGTTPVACSVNDLAGNRTTGTFNVIVTGPSGIPSGVQVTTAATGQTTGGAASASTGVAVQSLVQQLEQRIADLQQQLDSDNAAIAAYEQEGADRADSHASTTLLLADTQAALAALEELHNADPEAMPESEYQNQRDAYLANIASYQAMLEFDEARIEELAALETAVADHAAAVTTLLATAQAELAQLLALVGGQTSVTASLTGAGGAAELTVASYNGNPTSATYFDTGGKFTDVNVRGLPAGSGASATVKFYYPVSITGDAETQRRLTYFNGSQWVAVLSGGGALPSKNTADNLDGTASGGRFSVTFDQTSTPKITDLGGTVFADGSDTTPPVLSAAPANQTPEAAGPNGAAASWTDPTATDDLDGSVPVVCAPASGGVFPLGTTTVSCTAADGAGNVSTAKTFTVTVQDTTAPVLTLPVGVATAATSAAGAPVSFTATATDLVDGGRTVTCTPASGATFPVGTTAVNCTATDTHSNSAAGTFPVTVTPFVAPSLFQLKDFVVLSSEQTWLLKGAQVLSGDVGANQPLPDRSALRDGRFEVQVGQNVRLADGTRVVADSVWLRQGSSVWDVLFNELRLPREGGVRHNQTSSLTLPLVTLPAVPAVTAGATDIEVKKNQSQTLAAGSYRNVTVLQGGTLVLSGGLYKFASLDLRQNAKVLVRAATEVQVVNELDTDKGVFFGADPAVASVKAKDVKLIVVGVDDKGPRHDDDDGDAPEEITPTVVQFGQNNTVKANVYAPNGTVWLKKGTEGVGSFVGKKVRIAQNVTLSRDSAY